MSAEATVALGYALFLVCCALGLDLTARHVHSRSGRFRTAGFTYHGHLDAWECPEGQHLRRFEQDHGLRLVRYRGKAVVCNACPVKADCTDSDQGREIVRPLDPWPRSEAGRFHRGIALAMLTLAALVCAAALTRNYDPPEIGALGTAMVVSLALLGRMATELRATPTNFPV